MQITEHFKSEEFNCKDGTIYPPEWIVLRLTPLCKALEIIRKALGDLRIRVVSGYRTPIYNKKVGGVKNSQHIQGIAVDFKVYGQSARKVAEHLLNLRRLELIPSGGIGSYSGFTHYDIRGNNAYWRGK